MKKHICTLRWGVPQNSSVLPSVLPADENEINNRMRNFVIACWLNRDDNVYPFERFRQIEQKEVEWIDIDCYTVNYSDGYLCIEDELFHLIWKISIIDLVIYIKHFRICEKTQSEVTFEVFAEIIQ